MVSRWRGLPRRREQGRREDAAAAESRGRRARRWRWRRRKRGAEDTRPARATRVDTVYRPSRIVSRLLATVAVLGVGALAATGVPPLVAELRADPYFALTDIVVSPTRRLSTAAVLDWAGVQPGMSIWDVDPAATARRLEQHPIVARATVRREPPRRVIVGVEERRPVAIVLLAEPTYVDRRGVAFVALRPDEPLDLPFITGIEAALIEGDAPYVRHAIRRALGVMRTMQAAGLPFRVSEVHIDRQEGITVFPVEPRIALAFGWRGLTEKVERLQKVLGAFGGREAQVRAIDLRVAGEAVIRLATPRQADARAAPGRTRRAAHET